MEATTLERLKEELNKGKEFIIGQMGHAMKVYGSTTKWMDKVLFNGQTVDTSMELSKVELCMVLEFIRG